MLHKKVLIVETFIQLRELEDWIWDPACGAVICFLGTVRNINLGKEVLEIEYSAYPEMALKEMHRIVDEAFKQWPLSKCAFVHRVGKLKAGDAAVALLVSSEHREPGFYASQWIISEMKKQVPIWKKEFYQDGSSWLGLQCDHTLS